MTAEFVCAFRAMEHRRDAAERLLSDPYAAGFLRRRMRMWATRSPTQLNAGAMATYVAARHRFIDDALVGALADAALGQVVILGAGYDARAHRFAQALDGRPVWELDLPAIQGRKRGILGRMADLPGRDGVRYVPIDFSEQTFDEALIGAGFRPGVRTFFVWEGVSMYLDGAVVADAFERMRRIGGAGTEVCADFWYRPRRHRLGRLSTALAKAALGLVGEPLRFELRPDALPGYFVERGFDVVRRAGGRRWLADYGASGRLMMPWVHVAHVRSA